MFTRVRWSAAAVVDKEQPPYRLVFILLMAGGTFHKLEAIWILADIVNGLMAIPNLIALLFLSGICVRETKKYMDHLKTGKPYEEYED